MAGYAQRLTENGRRAFLIQQVKFPATIPTAQIGIPLVWDNRGDGDWLTIQIENQVVWEGVGTDFDEDTLIYAFVPSAGLAGLTKTLTFVLKGTGQPNAQLLVWGTRDPEILSGPFPYPFSHQTLAGDGTPGDAGDDGPAVAAQLNTPSDVVADTGGNLFIADEQNHRIRRIDALTGDISTYAGNGTAGFSGDGGAATEAQLSSPSHLALDSDGNLFISDRGNQRVRRVDAVSLEISTVAGDGAAGYDGDNLPATTSSLNGPSGLAVDTEGNIFIADRDNQRIRKVLAITQNLVNIAGFGSAGAGQDGPALSSRVNFPEGLALADANHLLVADTKNHQVRKIDLAAGTIVRIAGGTSITGFADGELASQVGILEPVALAVDGAGNIFVAERGTHSVLRIHAASQRIRTFSGQGIPGFSSDELDSDYPSLHTPSGLAVLPSGEVLVAERGNHRLRKITPQSADLKISFDQLPQRMVIGVPATIVVRIENEGALAQSLTELLTGSWDHVTYQSITPSIGVCVEGLPFSCDLGTLGPGASATVTIQAVGSWLETADFQFNATGSRADLDPSDDTLTVAIEVLPVGIFSDAFESGNVTLWSVSSGYVP